ncbi:hypothetical protein BXT86_03105 [candidate division WOR-3 bacterium 4484_100]|uniref:AAA+ ATPase domain-containing protein n=1 Tax=candidate division WOR-3 bacterium 4484_100 TaxID=1936077 RepID=A0A1V4QFD6_UNCW3|nr:MAG: hypothetical protein BXT86_03105 [candidate division WOR-3 bacterium 4484_100]
MKRVFSFENFYVHDGNKVAYLAAKKIIEFPGELFNPFYIYGGTGLGKTHLLRALYNELTKNSNPIFLTAPEFEQYMEENKEYDRILIIDDIHNVSEKYQRKILGMVDIFISSNIQLCFSGVLPPRQMKNFDQRLLSRLEGGLVCELQPPKEFALINLIKKKSEEAGIILPDDIALELAQVSTGSIRTIEGMINRLVAYSSLGNQTLDINSVRLILKEFYPKGIYSPVSSLLEELKKNASEVLEGVSEKLSMRDEYKEKIYVWEMKGFDTSALKPFLDGDLEILKTEYDNFIKKVERLIELQKEYGALDTSEFPDLAMRIESMLFSPDRVEEIEGLISEIKKEAKAVPVRSFDNYIIGECNRSAYELYKNQIAQNPGREFNPFIILGDPGTGKTHFLEAVKQDLQSKNIQTVFYDIKQELSAVNFEETENFDALIFDNFQEIFSAPEDLRKKVFEGILRFIEKDKAIIIGAQRFTDKAELTPDERMIFEVGLEVELGRPSPDLVKAYFKSRLPEEQAVQIIEQGVPQFSSFYEIEEYLKSIESRVGGEVIPLGLPGEEEKEGVEKKEIPESEKEPVTVKPRVEEPESVKQKISIRFLLPELTNELIEENF